ncbi:MAG TPA: glycosyltransferase family 39 protein [Anaeromyxobacteraceae bacterium]|nr:glycosyltransferase family 39 protein [Anaeromyxobacteraceae bacterium]
MSQNVGQATTETPPRPLEPARPGRAGGRTWLAAAVALAVAFALRLPLMNAGLFHHDEVQLARAVEGSYRQHRILPAVKGRHGAVLLNLAFYAPYHAMTGRSAERVVPFTGIATGALLVALMVLLAAELAGDGLAGALAGAFTGGSALFLTSSSTGKENVPQMALVALALWLLARGAARPSAALRIAGLATFGFALTVHEGGVLLVPPFALSLIALAVHHGRPWRAAALDLAVLLASLAVPMAASIWDELRRNLFVSGANSATFLGPFSPLLGTALRDAVVGLGAPTVALAAVGAALALRRRRWALLALLPWPLVIVYFGNVSSYTPRYLLYALPATAALAGAGAAALLRRWLPARAGLAGAMLAVAACAPGVARALPLLAARATRSGPKAMALLVRERTAPGAVILCQDDSPHLEYYAPGRTLLKQPLGDAYATAAFVHDLKERARGGTPVYAGAYAFTYDPSGYFQLVLQSAFALVPVGEVANEWFYRPELEDVSFRDVLVRLEPR